MKVYENELYKEDVSYAAGLELPWEKLGDGNILISGCSGLIGSFLIDVIEERNRNYGMNCRIYAVGRVKERVKSRFGYCCDDPLFTFLSHDINNPLEEIEEDIRYVIHLASNTHPLAYSTDPIGTVTTNIIGTYNMLNFAVEHKAARFAFASSNEIYGENRGDIERFDESYCGYIDCNTMRAGYPESKRCGEALCQAYIKQKGLDVVIPRLTRSYGPTLLQSDTKALSQFIKRGLGKQSIVLKSKGMQYYSYTYVADAVAGLLYALLLGKCGEAYNIADVNSDIRLRDAAAIIAELSGQEVIYELPKEEEAAGYSAATKAILDSSKLQKLGWNVKYDIRRGLERTLKIMENSERGDEFSDNV